MEEFDRFRSRIRSERHKIFSWMSTALELKTNFMVPDEENRGNLGRDGALNSGVQSLRRVLERDLTPSSQ